MLDRTYFEQRQVIAKAAIVDYRQRVYALEEQLLDLGIFKGTRKEQLEIQANLDEERGTLRWVQGREAEIHLSLWALDHQVTE